MRFSPVDDNDHQPEYRAKPAVQHRDLPYDPKHITYAQFLTSCQERNVKARPIGAFEPGGYLGPSRSEAST